MTCNVETIAQKLQTANDETKIKAIYFIEGLLAQEKMITVSPPTPGNEGACCHGEDR
ncbi:hypothetical protein FACS189499_10250 [Clostridia bacterium]|nr:hypothetical protein FACS189499_10250 [Clostridia bacterium]